MNICYLIVREEIYSPIIKTQVLDNLKELSKKNKIFLLWLCRVDYYVRKSSEYKKIKKDLRESNIDLIRIPIIIGRFPLNEKQLNFMKFQSLNKLERIVIDNDIEIINGRGYNASFLLLNLKIRKKVKIYTVFDARSPYLTEIKSTYGISDDSEKFEFWKNAEKRIAQNCDMTIVTSDSFKNYMLKFSDRVVLIPNNATMIDCEKMLKFNILQKRFVICYVGSIGYGWNDARIYAKITKKLSISYPEMKFEYYVMPAGVEIIKKELRSESVELSRVMITTENPENISMRIAGCVAGLQIMKHPDVRLGIKTVDYLSAGVPVICNNNAIGCAKVIEDFHVGVNIDRESIDDFIQSQIENPMYERCLKTAYDHYSTAAVARMYEECYNKINQKQK